MEGCYLDENQTTINRLSTTFVGFLDGTLEQRSVVVVAMVAAKSHFFCDLRSSSSSSFFSPSEIPLLVLSFVFGVSACSLRSCVSHLLL